MVHHLLKSLAERAPTNSSCTLHVREGELPNAGHHPILLHHGVGDLGHLLQVILCSWAGERDAMLASSELSAREAHPAQTRILLVERPQEPTEVNTPPADGPFYTYCRTHARQRVSLLVASSRGVLTCHCPLLSHLDRTSWKHSTESSRPSHEPRVSPGDCICGLRLWDKSKTTQWQPTMRHLHAHKCKPKIKTRNVTFLLPSMGNLSLAQITLGQSKCRSSGSVSTTSTCPCQGLAPHL